MPLEKTGSGTLTTTVRRCPADPRRGRWSTCRRGRSARRAGNDRRGSDRRSRRRAIARQVPRATPRRVRGRRSRRLAGCGFGPIGVRAVCTPSARDASRRARGPSGGRTRAAAPPGWARRRRSPRRRQVSGSRGPWRRFQPRTWTSVTAASAVTSDASTVSRPRRQRRARLVSASASAASNATQPHLTAGEGNQRALGASGHQDRPGDQDQRQRLDQDRRTSQQRLQTEAEQAAARERRQRVVDGGDPELRARVGDEDRRPALRAQLGLEGVDAAEIVERAAGAAQRRAARDRPRPPAAPGRASGSGSLRRPRRASPRRPAARRCRWAPRATAPDPRRTSRPARTPAPC